MAPPDRRSAVHLCLLRSLTSHLRSPSNHLKSLLEPSVPKRKPVFTKVDQLKSEMNEHTLISIVVSSNMVLEKVCAASVHLRQTWIAECLIGDETKTIIFTVCNKQVDVMKPGTTLILYNAMINIFKGSMRLAVDMWCHVEIFEPVDFIVKEENNLSLIEYELVNVVEA